MIGCGTGGGPNAGSFPGDAGPADGLVDGPDGSGEARSSPPSGAPADGTPVPAPVVQWVRGGAGRVAAARVVTATMSSAPIAATRVRRDKTTSRA